MNKKKLIVVIIILLILIFGAYVLNILSQRNNMNQYVHGTYKSLDKDSGRSLVFNSDTNEYYLYDYSDLLDSGSYEVSNMPNVYVLKDGKSKSTAYFIVESYRCYLIMDDEFSLFYKSSYALTQYN